MATIAYCRLACFTGLVKSSSYGLSGHFSHITGANTSARDHLTAAYVRSVEAGVAPLRTAYR